MHRLMTILLSLGLLVSVAACVSEPDDALPPSGAHWIGGHWAPFPVWVDGHWAQ